MNVFSYIYLATMAMPALEKSGGRLVVVGSGAGLMGLPKVAPYSASKHAIVGFFDSLRLELAEKQSKVSVTVCHLGNIDTASNRENTKGDLKYVKHTPADSTAMAILRATATRQREIFHPIEQGLNLMPKLRPWIPGLLDKLLLVEDSRSVRISFVARTAVRHACAIAHQ